MEIISAKAAKDAGLKHYFTGKPCKNGHIALRHVKGFNCVICQYERAKKWRSDNPERAKDMDRAWRDENRDTINKQSRDRYAKNPEKFIAKTKAYYAKEGDSVRKRRREYHYESYKDSEV